MKNATKWILVLTAISIIAILLIPNVPVKIMGIPQPIGIAGFVQRTNGRLIQNAVVAVEGKQLTTDAFGRFVTSSTASEGQQITAVANYNGLHGTKTVSVDFSQPTQWLNITVDISVDFIYSPGSPQPNDTITFNEHTSGPVVSWNWNFGAGVTSSARNPTHVYSKEGTYSVTLTVTDDIGTTKSATKGVRVAYPPIPPKMYTFIVKTIPSNCSVTLYGSTIQTTDLSAPKSSGTKGEVNYSLSPGTYTLSVGKTGYLYKSMTIEIVGDKTLVVDLTKPEINPFLLIIVAIIVAFILVLIVYIRRKKSEKSH